MGRCQAIKGGGERCNAAAMDGFEHCFGHRDDLADVRRRNAQKGGRAGGRGRPNKELQEIKHAIRDVTDAVLAGELKTAPAAVGLQGFNSLLRALEIERRTFDTADLLVRLDDLEQRADRLRGA